MPSKEYDYLVTLKKNISNNAIDLISRLLLLIAFCALLYIGWVVSRVDTKSAIIAFTIAAFTMFWRIYCYLSKGKVYYRLALFAVGVSFLFLPSPSYFSWIGIFYILAGLLEKQAKFPLEIGFDDSGIVINSIPVKNYLWKELNNVVMNGGLLTLDFKNNKLFQKETQDVVSKDLESEFNAFCKKHLTE
ncbi:hypothetical protein A9P82_14020 [Arachidicoccus ginsenosidimutans]|uniref:hypothetical protein n=1 Tax=Arachidicoccus sp. BS20 TaxID=1850526 RepID=UPI0007F16090|nr:hypothetical protein [Arachidicoccus sp. BS20]ANI90311.1 hypothetical protein A9P82_14020 [Arachidicoccus sp. BS20]